jgi:hypothetical protein
MQKTELSGFLGISETFAIKRFQTWNEEANKAAESVTDLTGR